MIHKFTQFIINISNFWMFQLLWPTGTDSTMLQTVRSLMDHYSLSKKHIGVLGYVDTSYYKAEAMVVS